MSLSPSVFLLPDAEKDALESAVHRRFSCRAFGAPLPDAATCSGATWPNMAARCST